MADARLIDFPAVGIYRFYLRLRDAVRLPAYPGSTWRGLLGHGLRRSTCVTRQRSCDGCLLLTSCTYSRLFETPAPNQDEPGYQRRPHPYVLVTAPDRVRDHAPDETLEFGINLIGAANDALPYIVHALTLAGQRGLTRSNSRFDVAAVAQRTDSGDWRTVYEPGGQLQDAPLSMPTLPECPDFVRVQLVTPLRLKQHGRLVGPREFSTALFASRLAQRLGELHHYHGSGDARPTDGGFDAPGIDLRDLTLRWRDWTRYSSRQRSEMQMGGLLGEFTLGGLALADLWPYLWVGQYTHLGKGTSLGLGQYRLDR